MYPNYISNEVEAIAIIIHLMHDKKITDKNNNLLTFDPCVYNCSLRCRL